MQNQIKGFIRIILKIVFLQILSMIYILFDSLLFVGTDLGLSTININNNYIEQIDFLEGTEVYNISK